MLIASESNNFPMTGSIDGKFEYGYLVTMKIGSETLRGALFRVGQPGEASTSTAVGTLTEEKASKERKRSRSAYNFYFAEQYSKLKALYPQRNKEFSKMIGESWKGLSEEERKVYRDRGEEDRERYMREMEEYREYRKKQKLQQSNDVAEPRPSNAKNDEPK